MYNLSPYSSHSSLSYLNPVDFWFQHFFSFWWCSLITVLIICCRSDFSLDSDDEVYSERSELLRPDPPEHLRLRPRGCERPDGMTMKYQTEQYRTRDVMNLRTTQTSVYGHLDETLTETRTAETRKSRSLQITSHRPWKVRWKWKMFCYQGRDESPNYPDVCCWRLDESFADVPVSSYFLVFSQHLVCCCG